MARKRQKIVRREWDAWYEDAKRYYELHGDLLVPMKYVTPEGYRLGQWIYCMRRRYHGAPRTAPLYGDEIARLERIGMVWRLRKRPDWDDWLDMAAAYYREHGDLLVPPRYVTPGGYHLGPWINSMRQKYKGNDDGPPLTDRQIHALEAYGMVWEVNDCPQWEGWLALAARYREEHGDLLVPEGCRPDGHHLDEWICGLRVKYRKGLLSEEQIGDLDRLGMVWEPGRTHPWEEYREAAARYAEQYGDLLVPAGYVTPEGLTLGKWISMQRSLHNHPGRYAGKKPLSGERVRSLEALGMVWKTRESRRRPG